MKTLKKLSIVLMIAALTSCYAERAMVNAHNDAQITFQTFYNELDPYGQWVEDYDLGYLWIPHVNQNFHPYATDGYWTMTNYGNTWVSDYSWGWAPFHYGRWLYDDYLGWAWTPGYEWAPAWVNWRSGGGYYGWAPMGPRGRVNMNMHIPWSHWVFLPQQHMYGSSMHSYYNMRNRNIYQQTTIINNTYVYNDNRYYSGPSAQEVERSSGRRVTVRDITNSGRAGRASVSNRSVSVYRPEVSRNSERNERPSGAVSRTGTNTGNNNSGRTSNSTDRNTNIDRGTNRTTPQSGRNNSTVNQSNRRQQESSGRESNNTNRNNSVNRSTEQQTQPTRNSSVNRSTEQQTQPTRTNRETENRSNATQNRSETKSGSVSGRTTNNANSRSTTNSSVNNSTTNDTRQATSGRSNSSNTRSNSSATSTESRSPAPQSSTVDTSRNSTRENTSTRSSSTTSGRGR